MIVQYATMVFYGRSVSWQPIIRVEGYRTGPVRGPLQQSPHHETDGSERRL